MARMDVRAPMMLLAALLGLAAPADRAIAAPAVMHLATDTEARWVNFELTSGNQIRFRTQLNGRWVDALLDTGVSDTAVTTRFARVAGLKPLVPTSETSLSLKVTTSALNALKMAPKELVAFPTLVTVLFENTTSGKAPTES